MINALKFAMVHKKKYFSWSKYCSCHHQNTKIAMLYKLKLPHENFSLSTMSTTVKTSWQLLGKKISLKHINMGPSFEDLIETDLMVKTDF